MMVLGLQQGSHHQGREDRQGLGSIAQLLVPSQVVNEESSGAQISPTVNGRTLIATLMEEAPSDIAIAKRQTCECTPEAIDGEPQQIFGKEPVEGRKRGSCVQYQGNVLPVSVLRRRHKVRC